MGEKMKVKENIKVEKEYKDRFFEGTDFQDYCVDRLYDKGFVVIPFSSRKYQILYGESKTGVEFKYDKRFRKTGNFYIETHAKPKNSTEFHEEGIYRDDNTIFWCIGDYEGFYLLSKKQLKQIHKKGIMHEVATDTSKGFLLPVEYAQKYLVIMEVK